jgi:hypothetical protein
MGAASQNEFNDMRPQSFLNVSVTKSDPQVDADKDSQRSSLPPQPRISGHSISRKPLPGKENRASELFAQPRSPSAGYINDRASIDRPGLSKSISYFDPTSDRGNDQDAETNGQSCSKPFSITFIRRDPSSGAQWNIGKIRGQPMEPTNATKSGHVTATPENQYNDIFVQLTTPGYNRFREQEATRQMVMGATNVTPSHESTTREIGFGRQVRMVWSKPRESEDHESSVSGASSVHTRPRSNSDFRMSQAINLNIARSLESSKSSRPRARGYAFASPWNGKCEFMTGTGGRSLKCKHTLPGPTTNANGVASTPQPSVGVSELRYNLPASIIFGSPVTSGSSNVDLVRSTAFKFHHIKNKLSSEHARPGGLTKAETNSYVATSQSEDDEDDWFGSRLGQEKAGGGNRGKRAKLGKLIIHDEGLKMLDLIVAANMGIWWGTWER